MLYRDIAKIDGPLSIRVEETVRERDADLQARRHAVSRHSSWRRLLRAEYQARFDGLRERWDVGLSTSIRAWATATLKALWSNQWSRL